MEQKSIKQVNLVCFVISIIGVVGGSVIALFLKNQYWITILIELLILIPIGFRLIVDRIMPTSKQLSGYLCALAVGIMLPRLFDQGQMSMIFSQMLLFLPALIYIIYKRESFFQYIRLKKITLVTVFLTILLTCVIYPVMACLNLISMLFSTNIIGGSVGSVLGDNVFKGLFLVAIVPAFAEESVYRGVIYHTFKKADARKGILLSGLIFGAIHMNFNQFIYAFALGIIMAIMVEATDSILTSMLMHFLINGTSVLASMVDTGSSESAVMDTGYVIQSLIEMTPVVLICIVISIFLIRMIAKRNGRLEYLKGILMGQQTGTNERIVTPLLAITLVICLLFAVAVEILARFS